MPADHEEHPLHQRLTRLAVTTVEEFVERYAPDFGVPLTFGGHLVGTDAVADLAFTLGWLAELGVDEVAGTPIDDATRRVLLQIDGPATHSFFSYRVAETLLRRGPFDANPLLDGMTPERVANVRAACDSTELLVLLDALPRNYLAVLARCEIARQRLGIIDDTAVLDRLLARTRRLLGEHPKGFLDEAHDGAGRFDIYTVDLYLFCEPMATELGETWRRGAVEALDLAAAVAAPDGAAVTWGRSTGSLAYALTLELAALAAQRRDLGADAAAWTARAGAALDSLEGWFSNGTVTAYHRRSPEDYRGPHRRLQLTFDLAGKLAYAAAGLRDAPTPSDAAPAPAAPPLDELRRFDPSPAAVWAYRSDELSFVLPFVSGRSSDYLPAPRLPGLFEVPTDSVLGCFVPVVHSVGPPLSPQRRFVPGEAPTTIEHTDGRVVVGHDTFVATRPIDGAPSDPDRYPGRRRATYTVDGAAIVVDEELEFDQAPEALSVLVPSVGERGLRATAELGTSSMRVRTVDVDGMKEWRTAWGQTRRLTEIEIEPARRVSLRWRMAPRSIVTVTSHDAGYVRTVYDPIATGLGARVVERPWTAAAAAGDVVHVHWPEWCFGYEATFDDHVAIAADLCDRGVRIAWTQHNLTPHLDDPATYDPIYQAWADACDLAIHHSEWGRDVVTDRYRFRDGCRHVVIPHPHFGPAVTTNASIGRDEAADRLGLDDDREGAGEPPTIRIGLVGAPRKEKDLRLVVDALAASGRTDVQLVIWSLSFTDPIPDHPQVVAAVYDHVDRATYDLRLAACDVVALPFTGHTMLATGTASDLVGTGTPALVSDWPYLTEHLGDAAIRAGQTVDSWAAAIAGLDRATLDAAAAATTLLRDRYDPSRIANATADAIEQLGLGHG